MKLDRLLAVRTGKNIYRDNNRTVKVFDSDFSKSGILSEALSIARIEETGLNIPKLCEVTQLEGKWAIISEYIRGKTMAQLIAEQPERFEEYLEIFVNLQLKIQHTEAPVLNALKDRHNRNIAKAELDATTRFALHDRLANMPLEKSICHGDYDMTNVVMAEDGTPYVIDWPYVTVGNAAGDAAETYTLFWLAGEISKADRYLEVFSEKSGISQEEIRYWLPIVAASRSVTCGPEKREFLLSWAKDSNR